MFEVGQRVKTTENSTVQKDFRIDGDSSLTGTITVVDSDDDGMPYKVKFDNDDANDNVDGTWVYEGEIEPIEEGRIMFEVGQQVKIVQNQSGHGFNLDEVVKVTKLDQDGQVEFAESLDGVQEWFVTDEEIEPIEESEESNQ